MFKKGNQWREKRYRCAYATLCVTLNENDNGLFVIKWIVFVYSRRGSVSPRALLFFTDNFTSHVKWNHVRRAVRSKRASEKASLRKNKILGKMPLAYIKLCFAVSWSKKTKMRRERWNYKYVRIENVVLAPLTPHDILLRRSQIIFKTTDAKRLRESPNHISRNN